MKKLLPPVLFLIFVVGIGLLHWKTSFPPHIAFPCSLLGLPLVVLGLWLSAAGKRLFAHLNTNIMTFGQPTLLVTQGIYQYTRNPMYLGFAVALLGVAILSGASLPALFLTLLFILITDRWYIRFEEQILRDTFGQDYDQYCRQVRRWV
ncbi:methyltransferase family protein [Vibrio coralliilyticus]|uniref:methyltransferase family protein n=1 Tax=Vibrio coralliilyticus TaxID=190893 RepID=UPI0024090DAE|nr:isoprenylcysteine carboxylmethyltransferase family protein [Vibrio coralliilyticus]WFB50992.1 isoprenylcysteine carboxylmethyltransferase family protein [Vibrio coralliilyticus]